MERGGQFHGHRRKIRGNSSASALQQGSSSANKSNTSNNNSSPGTGQQQARRNVARGDQEHYMPIANLIRVMRRVLPAHAKISDDAKETIQECVSEYISFVTSEANDRCHHELRKTITAEDVIAAMAKLGFDDYIEPLTVYLHRYRESESERDRIPVPLRRGVDYGSLTAMANYGAQPVPAQALHIGNLNQQGLHNAEAIVTRDYFKEGAGASGSNSSPYHPEYK